MTEEGKPDKRAILRRGTKVEYVEKPEDTAQVRDVLLFLDVANDRIGIEPRDLHPDDPMLGRYQVPLSAVLDLLKRGAL